MAITYKRAGVDIKKADDIIRSVKTLANTTRRSGLIGGIGGFSALFKASFGRMKEPILAASTDGVGTKLLLANIIGKHDTVGIDLVAMCVNDIVACGAEPLFFLDYFATGQLNKARMINVVKGVTKGCREAECALIGGETAELPGMYRDNEYDLAGFSVGVVDKKKIIDGSAISPGDVVIGLPSSGPHSNGYSLIRRLFHTRELKGNFKNILLKPTTIYVKPILALLKNGIKINGIAHITGGGFYDNILRILPKGRAVVLNPRSWKIPKIFKVIAKRSRLDKEEMYKTFNMGIGMVLILNRRYIPKIRRKLSRFKLKPYIIGEVVKGKRKVII